MDIKTSLLNHLQKKSSLILGSIYKNLKIYHTQLKIAIIATDINLHYFEILG